jgi:hypothetical protein
MNGFVGFMHGWEGRLLRIVAGFALIASGLVVAQGAWRDIVIGSG